MVAELSTRQEVISAAVRDMQATLAARRVVDTRAMLAEVKAALAEVEAEFVELAQGLGDPTVELQDGTTVTLIEADRRKIDANVLADALPKSVFDIVTEAKVNHKRFDAAAETGLLDNFGVEDAITVTPYTAIRVTKS